MSLQGLFTHEGITKSVEAENNEGFRIRPIAFAVSEDRGILDPNRSTDSLMPLWYRGPISSVTVIEVDGSKTLQFNCNIPAGVATDPKYTKEIYLFAVDSNTETEYLLALSQPSTELTYDPEGELRLRLQLKINNIDISTLYDFYYTQATEIEDHNLDPNAHPSIQRVMNKAGIYVQQGQNAFNGQNFDGFPAKAPTVTHGSVVYWDAFNNRYDLAIDNGTDKKYGIGFYDSLRDIVIYGGVMDYPHTLAPYTPIYLSTSVLGGSSSAPSSTQIGTTLPNNKIFVGSKFQQATDSQDFDGDMTVNLSPPVVRELTLKDENGINWDVKITDEGLLYTVPNSIRDADPIFRIPKIDLSSAQLKVKPDGELIVVSPPTDVGISDEFYYIASPSGINWKLTVDVQNNLITQAYLNAFTIRSERQYHFMVRQTDIDHALTYTQVYDGDSLPESIPEAFGKILPFCFYDNGSSIRPIFWDGVDSWRYFHDNSVV